ncbi:MAG: hypothetical protein PHC64_01895 [Candidatus Gastranaerophilales bacterium]|nr:hypothetical protein [Candidatus Gastranaerophilales bacterium]
MQYQFLNIFLDQKELLKQAKIGINTFLLENNASQLEKIYNFYKSGINLLYVNGFLGAGKAQIVNYSTNFLSADTIVLKYNCFNSTVLDDILLSFYSDFKKLSSQNIIIEPKIKTENFTQKVNSYFSQIEKSFLIIIDSFEEVLEENRKEILDFIFHLNSMQKVKIIIIGRTFESKYFKNISIELVTVDALGRQLFDKYMKEEKIKAPSGIVDEFYKDTGGYYFFTTLSINLMKHEKLSLVDFLVKLKNSYLPFDKFLGKQALNFPPVSQRNLFWLLSTIRHPISIELLKTLNLYNQEEVNFLTKNLIIIEKNFNLYVHDFFKEAVDGTVQPHVLQKFHQYIIDLYSTQLPLKPSSRDICISRQTMRKEIEYHKLFLPKKPKAIETPTVDINYLSYSQAFDFGGKTKPVEKKEEKQPPMQIDLPHKKNIDINLENMPFQQQSAEKVDKKEVKHEAAAKLIPNHHDVPPEYGDFTLDELMEKAKLAEDRYDYASVINICQKAVTKKEDKNYRTQLPIIYTKLAKAYQKNSDYEKSLEYYNLLREFYKKAKDFVKVNYVKFNIAKIFYETYKIDNAKELFVEIIKSKNTLPSLMIKCYLQLANLEESLPDTALNYYNKALGHIDKTVGVDVLSELYFKYALIMDDRGETKTAIEFYNKCINLPNADVNRFLSAAYSNIATVYLEKNDVNNALKNYQAAYEIDKQSSNMEGTYYSASKLASILQRKHPDEALEYLNIALDCAKLTKDVFYIVSALLAIGDYYYDKNKNEIALRHYINALDLAENTFSQDNIDKINVRINDIRFRIDIDKFDELVGLIRAE